MVMFTVPARRMVAGTACTRTWEAPGLDRPLGVPSTAGFITLIQNTILSPELQKPCSFLCGTAFGQGTYILSVTQI
jgi:hypothetical protein